MQNSISPNSTAQYGTAQHRTAQSSTEQHGTTQHRTVQNSTEQHSTTTTQNSTGHHSMLNEQSPSSQRQLADQIKYKRTSVIDLSCLVFLFRNVQQGSSLSPESEPNAEPGIVACIC